MKKGFGLDKAKSFLFLSQKEKHIKINQFFKYKKVFIFDI